MFIINYQNTKKQLKCRKFHGIYWAALGFLDTENAGLIDYDDN